MSRYTDMVDARLDAGYCGRCGERPPRLGYKTCQSCADKSNNNRKKNYTKLKEKGLCVNGCKVMADDGHVYCKSCRKRMSDTNK